MLEFTKSDKMIIIKGNRYFLGIGVIALFMAFVGVRLVFGILPFDEDYTAGDVFGLIFICAWIALVLSMAISSFSSNSMEITMNSEGVMCSSLFRKQLLAWSEIQDWGLSYCGQTRGEGNTYYLYFSDHICEPKNECRKKLKGRMIKTIVMGEDYSRVVSEIIPFCEARTLAKPFVGKDKYHFL